MRCYVAAIEALGISQDAVLSDDLVHGVAQFVQARPQPTPSETRQDFAPQGKRMEDWLAASGS